MKVTKLTLPEISLIAGTRVALGAGLALLFADRMTARERKSAGWGLFLVGAATTVPIARMVLDRRAEQKTVPTD